MKKSESVFLKVLAEHEKYVVPCYRKQPVVFSRGKGSWLWDVRGKKYLDFFSGWAVSSLGHAPRPVARALSKQSMKLLHLPNNYYHEGQGTLARLLIENSFPGKVFFCNSGAEAVEAAIKAARAYGNPDRYEILTLEKSFHGRTSGALAATGQSKYQAGFDPILSGFRHVPLNDYPALEGAVSERTVAVLMELVQGEGGVRVADPEYVRKVRELCDRKNLLLIFDEVQTGAGRTGKMFAFEHYGVKPDGMVLAKALGGGFPIGAFVAADKIADILKPGMHASTFGGNPLACVSAAAVLTEIKRKKLAQRAAKVGAGLLRDLKRLARKHSCVQEARGLGLLLALELKVPADPIFAYCLKKGLLVNATQNTVLRMAPPLTVTASEIRFAMRVIDEALGVFGKETAQHEREGVVCRVK